MKPRTLLRIWPLSILLCGFLLGSASADSHARIVRLSYLQGDVQVDRNLGQGFERALLNMPLIEGMKLWTRDGAEAEVEFEDGSTVRLAPGSGLVFSELGLRDSGARVTTVEMPEGTAYFDVLKSQSDEFRVRFPDEDILLDHPVRFRAEVDRNEARLAVFKGELNIDGDAHSVRVKKNETITLDLSDPAHYLLANLIQPGPFDSWNADRERFRTQYSTAGLNLNGPNPNYFFADLSYYGSTVFVPGCGFMWRPSGVGLAWDPFGNGSWAWYPGAGYAYVSSYPWGWAPYRYGSWCYNRGFGWGWQPGNTWNTWNSAPVVTVAPPGWHRPVAPPSASGRPGETVVMGPGNGFSGAPVGEPGPVMRVGEQNGAGTGNVYLGNGIRSGGTAATTSTSGSSTVVTMGSPTVSSETTTRGVIPDRYPRGETSVPQRPTTSVNMRSHSGDSETGGRNRDSGVSRPTSSPAMSMSHSEASRPAPTQMSAPMSRPSASVSSGGGAVHSGGEAKPKQ